MLAPLEVLNRYAPHDGTLWSALETRVAAGPARPFLLHRGRSWAYEAFRDDALALARVLHGRGVRHGDRVGVMARSHAGHVLLLWALSRLGAIMVPTNPEFGAAEARYVFGNAGVSAVAITAETAAIAREAVAPLAPRPWLIGFDPVDAEDVTGLDALMAAGATGDLPPPPVPDDTCLIIFTSGSTGFPKGAMHSQRNFLLAGEANICRLALQPDDRQLTVLPMFHVNALFYSLAGTIASGSAIIVLERFSASTFWETAERTGATTVNVIEAIGRILAGRPRSEFRPGHRIRICYGARRDVQDCFRDEFHIPHAVTGFGMTEIPGVCCMPIGAVSKAGAMGRVGQHPDPGRAWAQCRVVDDDGNDVADDVIGEFWVKHPIVMQGYYGKPEETRAAFRDGWFMTGDLVRRDPDGFYTFISRKKDIIRRRGENIAGAELDRVVGEHPAVFEAAAVPVPSELGEDEILVAVVLREGMAATAASIATWCRERLAAHKVPRFVLFLDSLPHTPTHKINKLPLRNDATLKARAVDLGA
jgi:crotonobetaine/carnitine-CoA ligase